MRWMGTAGPSAKACRPVASLSLWVLGALLSPVDPFRTVWSEAQATLPASFPLPPRLQSRALPRNVKMPKSLEALPSFSQRLFLLFPFQSAHKVLSFVETVCGRGKRKTQVAVICR